MPAVSEDESYTLEVGERQAVLKAPTVVGVLRGLETFLQLLEGDCELGSQPGPYTVERRPGIFDPSLDPTREETYRFLDTFLGSTTSTTRCPPTPG